MKNEKSYKKIFLESETSSERLKVDYIKSLLKKTKKEIESMEDWEKSRFSYYLTSKQCELLNNNNVADLKKLLKKQIEKEEKKLQEETEKAIAKYNDIKNLIDIKHAIIDVEWSSGRRSMGAYQTKAVANVTYKDGSYNYFETGYTGGCGYDKPSTSFGEIASKLLKIALVKNYDKKIKNNPEKHYKFYAAENGYFQHGVGLNSYIQFFRNLGYKVQEIYHKNENTTIIIDK